MSGFSRQWLQLRESADHRARCAFDDELRALAASRWHLIDLGCGTGSNLRFLAAKLSGAQDWVCIDYDATLLEALADQANLDHVDSITTVKADVAADINLLLAGTFADSDAQACTIVTASALLDLVSSAWIDAVSTACAHLHVPALFALTYDGRIELNPGHDDDDRLRMLVNDHQLNDKGFGPALGPGAAQCARTAFERCGYNVVEAQSDWCLDSNDAELQRELLAGWVDAARERSGDRQHLRDWHERRLEQIETGALCVRVGHRDLLALPTQTPGNT